MIATSKRLPVVQFRPDHHKMDLSSRHFCKVNSKGLQERMARVLQIVLIHSVIDDTLHVTFVITNLEVQFESVV